MSVKAYILIATMSGRSPAVRDELDGMPEVTHTAIVTGPYDVIAIVEVERLEDVRDLVTRELHGIRGITKTITCVSVSL